MCLQPMIIIFIMTSRIEEKLIIHRAKGFAKSIDGIDSYSISLVNEKGFTWHREELKRVNSIKDEIEGFHFEQPVNVKELVEKTIDILHVDNEGSCCFIYEGVASVCVHVKDFRLFLAGLFKINDTYDICLLFKDPDRVFIISDDEHSLRIYYKKNDLKSGGISSVS